MNKIEYNDGEMFDSSDSEVVEKNIYSYNLVPILIATEVILLSLFILLVEYAITKVCGTKLKSQIYNSFPCFAHIWHKIFVNYKG